MDPIMNQFIDQRGIFPPATPVGMAYVPIQMFGQVYEPMMALDRGTIFPELDKPWLDGRAFAMPRRVLGPAVETENTDRGMENE